MKRDFVSVAIALMALAFGGALEELVPKVLGVGAPVLLSASAYFSLRRPPLEGILFAAAAGFAEDALSSLPFAMSASYFVALAATLRGFKLPLAAAAPAYAAYQIWIWVWFGAHMHGSVFMRVSAALPVGIVALLAVSSVLLWIDGKAAVDEK